jgi:acyl-CoA thioesterase-1
MRAPVWLVLAALTLAAPACGSRDDVRAERRGGDESAVNAAQPHGAVSPQPAGRPRVVILGDSLTAGLGLAVTDAYPAVLQARLNDRGLKFEIVNAGVSGDTSAGGLSRLDWALDGDVRVLIVALGGNDGLRNLSPQQMKDNLSQIIQRAQARGITVILAGMEAPPNFGQEYQKAFHLVFQSLAKEYHVALVPFLLEGVAAHPELNQRDGIHPNVRGAEIVADNVWPVLERTIAEARRP